MDHYYKYLRWLSLDIVLGAIFFLAYLEAYFGLSISWNVFAALGSAIWLIYTSDHLIDAKKVIAPTSDRHRFHQRHFTSLVFVVGVVFFLALINIYFLEEQIIKNGALLTAICVLYLLAVYFVKKLWVKELLVAAVYAVGVFLAPLTLMEANAMNVFMVTQLFGVALLNLLVFSFYDRETDRKDGFNSLVIRLGRVNANRLIFGLGAALCLSNFSFGIIQSSQIYFLFLLMTCVLLLVHVSPTYFSINNRYRTIGDGIFYLPGLLLLL